MVTQKASFKIPVFDVLTVTAEASWESVDGLDTMNMNTPYLTVRVMDQSGSPITGLLQKNFKVTQMGFAFKPINILGPGYQGDPSFEEYDWTSGIRPGTYKLRLDVKPSLTRVGQFVFAVVVTAPPQEAAHYIRAGQALAPVVKLK